MRASSSVTSSIFVRQTGHRVSCLEHFKQNPLQKKFFFNDRIILHGKFFHKKSSKYYYYLPVSTRFQ